MLIACDLFSSTIEFQKLTQKKFKTFYKKFFYKNKVRFLDTNSSLFKKNLDKIDIYWGNRLSIPFLEKMNNLKWIHFGSKGVSESILKLAKIKKIKITNTRHIFDEPVASTVFAYIFSLSRGINYSYPLKVKKKLSRIFYNSITNNIKDVFGSNILFVGYGGIAKKIAKLCLSLNMKIFVIKSNKKKNTNKIKFYKIFNLNNIVKNKYFIINTLPLNDKTLNVFNKSIFKNFSKDTIFINVGRGETVNEKDLIDYIKNKKILAAGLDVVNNEPIKKNSQLLKYDNIVLTPHIAGITKKYWNHQFNLFYLNYFRLLKKKRLVNLL